MFLTDLETLKRQNLFGQLECYMLIFRATFCFINCHVLMNARMTYGKLREMMFLGWISADMGSVPVSDKNLPVPLGNPRCIL